MTPPTVQLVVSRADGEPVLWPLAAGQSCLIGRGRTADLRIDDPYLSRQHCQIEAYGPRWVIRDLDSRTGTIVNGDCVRRAVLQPGDQIIVGRTKFTVSVTEKAPPVDARPAFIKASVASSAQLEDFLGKTIHHYCLERVLAQGEQSTVFLARHVDRNRDIAVKILLPTEGEDDRRRRRFIRAVQTFREIRHPNIVRLHGAGRIGPYCWLAMEYVPGENLKQVIDRIGSAGMLDWRTSFGVALDIARALDVAESHQIVHRNITPKSILLRSSDKVAKLADLMLAKTWTDTATDITPRGELVGDLAYMAPERVFGTTIPDHRSDIYGLGATVYGLLTGRPPFAAGSLPKLLDAMNHDQPRRPKQFQLSVSDMFEGAVLKMLAKAPEDRYPSVTTLVRDLERIGRYSGISVTTE